LDRADLPSDFAKINALDTVAGSDDNSCARLANQRLMTGKLTGF